MSNDKLKEAASALLQLMLQIGERAKVSDPSVQRYIDKGAVRIVNGSSRFRMKKFVALLAKDLIFDLQNAGGDLQVREEKSPEASQ